MSFFPRRMMPFLAVFSFGVPPAAADSQAPDR
jgi:hypothetical protein